MHHTQALKTLLQCLEDLTGTVETFGQEQKLHEVEKDLVLYRGRLLYEAILKLPTAAAIAPEMVSEDASQVAIAQAAVSRFEPGEVESKETDTLEFEIQDEISQEVETQTEDTAASTSSDDAFLEEITASIDDRVDEEERVVSYEPEITIDTLSITLEKENPGDSKSQPLAPKLKAVGLERFTIAEVLNQSGDKDLILTHLKLKPIQDLKSGIGLNEKFLFIRELFENDHQAYAQAVDALNGRQNIEEAEAYIANELLPRYGWELEKEALLNFLHLVLRRFSNS